MKVIIDTDIGDDIDDALALALALSSPELEVLAVTTVYGRVDVRAKLAAKILKVYGREDIPVAMGCSKPFINPPPSYEPNQAAVLSPGDRFSNIVSDHAVDLIVNILHEEPDVTVITLGPLTNLAMAILKDRQAFDKARLVMMGGCLTRPIIEYNISRDPEASSIVLTSGIPTILVGLDVTLKCRMPRELLELFDRGSKPQVKLLGEYLRLWRKATGLIPILHDPLAVAVSFREDMVKKVPKHVAVELRGEYTRGLTVEIPGKEPNVEACVEVAVEKFLDFYKSRVLG